MGRKALFLIGCLMALACSDDDTPEPDFMGPIDDGGDGTNLGSMPCDNGTAGPYACLGYDLMGMVSLQTFDAVSGSDVWGWTDPETGREYALMALDNGTAFIDITDDANMVYLGKLPTETVSSGWRDVKVYADHALIVSEAVGHGMQVFDLRRLRNVTNPPAVFETDAHYAGFGNAHNLVVNEDSGFAYVAGTARDDAFNGGVHFIDIRNPARPTAAGGYGDDGYSHDGLAVAYEGPDGDYIGREIYIGANENQISIVDVTDKDNPVGITTLAYDNLAYTHQGWFTEDQRYYILGDELDETQFGFRSRTLIFDFADLDQPEIHHSYFGPTPAIDHNGYVKGDAFYLANYRAGVRILDIADIAGRQVAETGFFDTFPANDEVGFDGVWSVYPYFDSGKIAVSDINSGLFIIRASE